MAEIEIGQETEGQNHWSYDVSVFDNGRTHQYRVTLSFSDYDLWSKGRVSPSRVVEAAFEFLLDQETPGDILSRFDCSVIRRYFPAVDKALPKRL
jgi:hypothetical protein